MQCVTKRNVLVMKHSEQKLNHSFQAPAWNAFFPKALLFTSKTEAFLLRFQRYITGFFAAKPGNDLLKKERQIIK